MKATIIILSLFLVACGKKGKEVVVVIKNPNDKVELHFGPNPGDGCYNQLMAEQEL